jgi:tetratricopeptide (TPR) repeat protein
MRLTARLLIFAFVPVLALFSWVSFPLSHALSGVSLPILGPQAAGLGWVSYGAAAALSLIVAAKGLRCERPRQLYYAGACLLLLTAAALLQLAFGYPRLLKRLADEADWNIASALFASRYLPRNLGTEPTQWRFLSFDSIGDRLISAWYFMGLGWYLAVGASLALSCAGALKMAARARRRSIAFTGLAIALMAAAFVYGPLTAEHELMLAQSAQARGHLDEAIRRYGNAIALDRWNALDLSVLTRMGQIDVALHNTSAPEYRVYYAEYLVQQNRLPEAIAEYEDLAVESGSLRSVGEWRAVELWTSYGLDLYANGGFGAAVGAWQRALAREPSMWLAAYYLTQGYFAVGRYQDAISLARKTTRNVADPIFLSSLYANLGDAYTEREEFALAHQAYGDSYAADYITNLRGLSSLVGP